MDRFFPHPKGAPLPAWERCRADLMAIAESGLNTVRTYDVPPPEMLELAAEVGLRIIVGLQYADWRMLPPPGRPAERRVLDAGRRAVDAALERCAGRPAVLPTAVGKEVPADLVRLYGIGSVEEVLSELIPGVHAADPGMLATYVNYPTTEFLDVAGQDLICFNVFLERPADWWAYLRHLQVVAGDRPLVVTECGLASAVHGESAHAEALAWQLRMADEAGVGVTVFSWTDEWGVGGKPVTGWGFGITTEDRRPKPAAEVVRGWACRRLEPLGPAIWPSPAGSRASWRWAGPISPCRAPDSPSAWSPPVPGGRCTFCSPTTVPSICPAATSPSSGTRSRRPGDSTRCSPRRATTWTYAGSCRTGADRSPSRAPPRCGTTAGRPSGDTSGSSTTTGAPSAWWRGDTRTDSTGWARPVGEDSSTGASGSCPGCFVRWCTTASRARRRSSQPATGPQRSRSGGSPRFYRFSPSRPAAACCWPRGHPRRARGSGAPSRSCSCSMPRWWPVKCARRWAKPDPCASVRWSASSMSSSPWSAPGGGSGGRGSHRLSRRSHPAGAVTARAGSPICSATWPGAAITSSRAWTGTAGTCGSPPGCRWRRSVCVPRWRGAGFPPSGCGASRTASPFSCWRPARRWRCGILSPGSA